MLEILDEARFSPPSPKRLWIFRGYKVNGSNSSLFSSWRRQSVLIFSCCLLEKIFVYHNKGRSCTMHRTSEYLAVLTLIFAVTVHRVYGTEGCFSVETFGNPVINMCESRSWTERALYISINTTNMGSNTVCSCTLTQTAAKQTPVFNLEYVDTTVVNCLETSIKIDWPGASHTVTCESKRGIIAGQETTGNIHLNLSRPDVFHGVSYCLSIIHQDSPSYRTLTCQGATITSTTATSTSSSTMAPQTESPSTSSSTATSSPETQSSSATSASGATGTTSGNPPSATSLQGGGNGNGDFPTGPVAGGIAGGCVLIIIIVLIVVCTRRKRQHETPQEERSGTVNRGYENVLTDNILYESSSGPPNNQSPPSSQPAMSNGEGAYQSLDENRKAPSVSYYNTSGGLATVSTGSEREAPIFGANDYATVDEVTPRPGGAEPKRTSAPPPPASPAAAAAPPAAAAASPAAASAPPVPAPKPPSDQYAVVTKPPRQNKPAQSADARSQSSNVTLPSGDVYAVVDRTRARGSEPTSPRYPPPQVAPPPAPAPDTTPGLVYADLELAPSPRSSARMSVPSTDYAEIDHEASARL